MTIFWTAIASVVTLILGQIAITFLIKPLQEQRNIIAEIAHDLTYYGNRLHREENESKEDQMPIMEKFRSDAAKLESVSVGILLYNFLAFCKLVIPMKDIIKARGHLISISGEVFKSHKDLVEGERFYQRESAEEVRKLLKIKVD